MWIKALGVIAIVFFVICLVAVLQGWSKSDMSGRFVGVMFIIVPGTAAAWGVRTLTGFPSLSEHRG